MKSILKKPTLNILKIITGLCVALFFGVNANAGTILVDNFNYSLGNLGDGWSTFGGSSATYQVVNDNCVSGNCLRSKSGSISRARKQGTATGHLTQSIMIFFDSDYYTGHPTYSTIFGCGDNVSAKINMTIAPGVVGLDTWTKVSFEWDSETNLQRYKIGDTVTDWYAQTSDVSTCDYVYIYSTNGAEGTYIDDLTFSGFFNTDEPGEVIIEELPDYVGTIQIGSETIIQYNRNNFCFLDTLQPCHLKFNYGYDSIGSDVYLLDQDYNIVATSTISEGQLLLQDRFLIPEPEQEETQQYCISLNNDGDIKTWCDIRLDWINNQWCDQDLICVDVATSSDFLFGVQCGFRQSMCWIFQPTPSSIDFLTKTIDNFTNSFPFNLPFALVKEIDHTIETASSSTKSFGLPMYSEETENFYIVKGIDPGQYYEILGTSTVDTLENQADMVLWLLVSLFIVYIIWKFAIHKK